MKKILCAILVSASLFAICAASKKKADVDLTRLPAALIYGEVFNMIVEPERYEGKIVRMKGEFFVYEDERNPIKKRTFACVIKDATACCAQGLEFTMKGSPKYPNDYPKQGTIVTVIGKYSQHEINGYTCTELVDCEFE